MRIGEICGRHVQLYPAYRGLPGSRIAWFRLVQQHEGRSRAADFRRSLSGDRKPQPCGNGEIQAKGRMRHSLEFLGLNERALVTDNDLEQSILDNLQHFLLEMGHGFCFEARQKHSAQDNKHISILSH